MCLTGKAYTNASYVGRRSARGRQLPGDQVGQGLVVKGVADAKVCLGAVAPSPQGRADSAELSRRRVPAQDDITMVGHNSLCRFHYHRESRWSIQVTGSDALMVA